MNFIDTIKSWFKVEPKIEPHKCFKCDTVRAHVYTGGRADVEGLFGLYMSRWQFWFTIDDTKPDVSTIGGYFDWEIANTLNRSGHKQKVLLVRLNSDDHANYIPRNLNIGGTFEIPLKQFYSVECEAENDRACVLARAE